MAASLVGAQLLTNPQLLDAVVSMQAALASVTTAANQLATSLDQVRIPAVNARLLLGAALLRTAHCWHAGRRHGCRNQLATSLGRGRRFLHRLQRRLTLSQCRCPQLPENEASAGS